MKRRKTEGMLKPIISFVGLFFLASSASQAQAEQVTVSCVFQGAGAVTGSVILDLGKRTVLDSYGGASRYPISEVTESIVRWQETDPNSDSKMALDRVTGILTRQMTMQGQAVTWTYACHRVKKQF
jgi:hypothetical protein